MDDDLKRMLEAIRQQNATAHAETRRHFDTVAEDLRHQMQLVAEGFILVTDSPNKNEVDEEKGRRPGGQVLRNA